jgi:hypothetical protein
MWVLPQREERDARSASARRPMGTTSPGSLSTASDPRSKWSIAWCEAGRARCALRKEVVRAPEARKESDGSSYLAVRSPRSAERSSAKTKAATICARTRRLPGCSASQSGVVCCSWVDVRPHEFDHILGSAANETGQEEFVVIGGQAILGSIDEPPEDLLQSMTPTSTRWRTRPTRTMAPAPWATAPNFTWRSATTPTAWGPRPPRHRQAGRVGL